MEESPEVHSDDNKGLPEKKLKRIVKTPSQVEALEKFYDEHKYPPETMKADLARSIGLTEKQVSGWFCHRRLKDKKLLNGEVYANGRQDRSSGVVQDRGSGFGQDSCGSTKQGDYRHSDTREVESRRFTSHDPSVENLGYKLGVQDTSSGSSSPLQDRLLTRNEDPFNMATSRYIAHSGNNVTMDARCAKGRSGPSGYLKVKGRIENAAITAVKRQLGRHYREDGPPLGVEFDQLPPDAFEPSVRDSRKETYGIGPPIVPHSLDIPRIGKQPKFDTRHEGYNSKMISQNSCIDQTQFNIMHGSNDFEDYSGHHQSKRKSSMSCHSKPFSVQNSSAELYEDSVGEMSVYDCTEDYNTRDKFGVDGRKMSSIASHNMSPYNRKFSSEQEAWHRSYDDETLKAAKIECYGSKPSTLILKNGVPLDLENRELSRRLPKPEKAFGKCNALNDEVNPARVKIYPPNEMRVCKGAKGNYPHQQEVRKRSMVEMPQRTIQIRSSAMQSCSSEEDTADSSSSMDS